MYRKLIKLLYSVTTLSDHTQPQDGATELFMVFLHQLIDVCVCVCVRARECVCYFRSRGPPSVVQEP